MGPNNIVFAIESFMDARAARARIQSPSIAHLDKTLRVQVIAGFWLWWGGSVGQCGDHSERAM